MKLNRVYFVVLFSIICLSLNAQVFVGGNFGFNSGTGNTKDGGLFVNKTSNYSFSLSPSLGKFISEKFAVGLALNITLSGNTIGVNAQNVSKSSSWGGSLFSRYYAITWNKFSVFGQADIGLSISNSSTKTGGLNTKAPETTNLFLVVYPGLSYDVSDKLSLQTTINILSLGYNYIIIKTDSYKENKSVFNMGAGLSNIVSLGAVTVGAIYKF